MQLQVLITSKVLHATCLTEEVYSTNLGCEISPDMSENSDPMSVRSGKLIHLRSHLLLLNTPGEWHAEGK